MEASMEKTGIEGDTIESLCDLLERFINLSLKDSNIDFNDWIRSNSAKVNNSCHEKMACNESACPGYGNAYGRCWLVAGTLCGGEIQGKFVSKVKSCTECKVFTEFIDNDPLKRLRELTFVLIHSLLLEKEELKNALSEVKTLSGLLPICAKCKSVKDNKGYWSRIENYLAKHSEVQFSQKLCDNCIKDLYPDIAEEIIAKMDKNKGM